MNDEARRKYEQELIEDAERIMAEIEKDPEISNMKAPEIARENIFKAIREMEAAEEEQKRLSEEEKELIELGKVYKRRKKNRKYLVVAAVAVMVLAMGITSVGGPEKIFEKVTWMMGGREQTNVDSDSEDVRQLEEVTEEEVYAEIEEKYGFRPVKIDYLPKDTKLQEATIGDEIQGINLMYGKNDKVDLNYIIRPNYRTSSFSMDVEDEIIDEYYFRHESCNILIKEYTITGQKNSRWKAEFSWNDVEYVVMAMDMSKQEFEKILWNLYFS